MHALHIALYAVLGTSAAFALVELGLCAYVASLYGGTVEEAYYNPYYGVQEQAVKLTTPPILDFLLFSAVWTLLISAGALVLPWFYSRRATGAKLNQVFAGLLISVYFVTWVFWLACFADLASYLGGGVSYNNYFNAILAFAVLLWLLFVALFVLNIIAICGVLASDWPGYIAIRGGQGEVAPSTVAPPVVETAQNPTYTSATLNAPYSPPYPTHEGVGYSSPTESVPHSNPPYPTSISPVPQQSELSGENIPHH